MQNSPAFFFIQTMQTIGNQTVFIGIQLFFHRIQFSGRQTIPRNRNSLTCRSQLSDLFQQISTPLRCTLLTLPIFSNCLFQFLIRSIQTTLFQRWRLITDQSRQRTSFGHHSFRWISDIIIVKMWYIPNQPIRPACSGHTCFFSRKKFQCSMGSKMNHSIGTKIFPDPPIKFLIFFCRFPVPVMITLCRLLPVYILLSHRL